MSGIGRRGFLQGVLVATTCAGPVVGAVAQAEEATDNRVKEGDPQAVALGYVHDAAQVDAAKYPRFDPSQTCANCSLMRDRTSEWGPCLLIGGRKISAAGWCSAWSPVPET